MDLHLSIRLGIFKVNPVLMGNCVLRVDGEHQLLGNAALAQIKGTEFAFGNHTPGCATDYRFVQHQKKFPAPGSHADSIP